MNACVGVAPGREPDHAEGVDTELFIGGKWVPASSGGRFDVLDPATGDVIASVADGDEGDAAAAVEAAVVADIAERTPGATRRTSEVGDAVAARVAG